MASHRHLKDETHSWKSSVGLMLSTVCGTALVEPPPPAVRMLCERDLDHLDVWA